MALIICPDCEKQVSSEARVCPNCGNPAKHKSIFITELGFDGVLFRLMVFAGIVVGIFFSPDGWVLFAVGLISLLLRAK